MNWFLVCNIRVLFWFANCQLLQHKSKSSLKEQLASFVHRSASCMRANHWTQFVLQNGIASLIAAFASTPNWMNASPINCSAKALSRLFRSKIWEIIGPQHLFRSSKKRYTHISDSNNLTDLSPLENENTHSGTAWKIEHRVGALHRQTTCRPRPLHITGEKPVYSISTSQLTQFMKKRQTQPYNTSEKITNQLEQVNWKSSPEIGLQNRCWLLQTDSIRQTLIKLLLHNELIKSFFEMTNPKWNHTNKLRKSTKEQISR